jgi:hypothetical protein
VLKHPVALRLLAYFDSERRIARRMLARLDEGRT